MKWHPCLGRLAGVVAERVMMSFVMDMMWRNTLAVIPLAMVVGFVTRRWNCRPTTCYLLWFIVLARFVAPAVSPGTVQKHAAQAWTTAKSVGDQWAATLRSKTSPIESVESPVVPVAMSATDRLADSERYLKFPAKERALFESQIANRRSAHRVSGSINSPAPIAPVEFDDPNPDIASSLMPENVASADTDNESALTTTWWDVAKARSSQWVSKCLETISLLSWHIGRFGGGYVVPTLLAMAAILVGFGAVGNAIGSNRLRSRTVADAGLTHEVESIARQMGIRRAPEAYLVTATISPLLLVGLRPVVLIPRALWGQLNARERSAVICHELAHLRRRDHWVRILELLSGAFYWWHPVMWWTRRRLHEIREACCDAYVTATLPEGRKAYASALIKTQAFLSQRGREPIPTALCMSIYDPPPDRTSTSTRNSSRVRKLTRRITMIMTENPGVRMSARGLALALTLALLAGLSTPAWSCDPPEGGHAKTCDGQTPAPAFSRTQPSLLGFLLAQDRGPEGRPSEDRMRDLHARMEDLRRQMEELEAQMRDMHTAPGQPGLPRKAPRLPLAPGPFGPSRGQGAAAGGECSQQYALPEDKSDALYELLAPSDVTVVVSRTDDGISINGSGNQCEVMDRFIELYTRGAREGYSTYDETVSQWESRWDSVETYPLAEGRAELVFRVLAFDDVPVLVSNVGDGVSVNATRPDQRTVADLIAIVGGGGAQRRGAFGAGNSWRAGGDGESEEGEWRTERDEDSYRRDVEREIRDAQREAEREAREAQREAELAVREAQREAEEAVREAEQEAREAQREAEEAVREAMREAESHARSGAYDAARNWARDAERLAARASRGEHVEGERRYDMPRERAELLFNLLAPSDVEVVVSWDGDQIVARGSEDDLNVIDGVVDIITRNLGVRERAEGRVRTRAPVAITLPSDLPEFAVPPMEALAPAIAVTVGTTVDAADCANAVVVETPAAPSEGVR